MPVVHMLHVGLGGTEFEGVMPAPVLSDAAISVSLVQRFRRRLIETPGHFLEGIEVQGHPLIRLQWIALCATAGMVLLRGGSADPDVWCLLLNGLEDEQEIQMLRAHVPMFQDRWERIEHAPRPVAVAGYLSPTWLANPAVVTVLGAFANSFFAQFGESG